MTDDNQEPDRNRPTNTRRDVLTTVTGVAVAGGLGTFTGTAAAWDQFDVAFPSAHEVWLVVGDDLHYDPPLVTHVIVDTDDGPSCRVVEFTKDTATTYPGHFGDRPVIAYDAGEETVLGVLPYNRHHRGKDRFSRPRCVLVNDHIDQAAAVTASKTTDCVQKAMKNHWRGHFKACWFDSVSIADPVVTEIDSCRAITEPGRYKLVADLTAPRDGNCLEIRTDGVVIDGNGHTIDGGSRSTNGGSRSTEIERTGILTDAVPAEPGAAEEAAPIRIHDVRITGFDTGVSVSGSDTVRLEASVISDCGRGVDLGTDRTDITLELADVTIRDCTHEGIRSIGFNTIDLADSRLKRNEVGIAMIDSSVEISGSRITAHDGAGLTTSDGGLDITDSTIENNGGHGVTHRFTGMTAENVTIRNNGDREIGVLPPATPESAPALSLWASDLFIGNTGTVATPGLGAAVNALDAIPAADLPSLPAGRTALAEGLEVIAIGSISLDLRFDLDSTADPVELFRFDGTDWVVLPEGGVVGDTFEVTVEEGGIYVPVS